ncbi:amidohydrolase [Altericroceibacterium endophyticum]|uniref:Amidohydrolase n=1 Tax=Altericroceibacterium endophyticum TaxID=1808508 RepID=A0A6I4T961_9SPHN|nr:amidohydrolase [Altericroceibacterium endophyticum]MXO66410.1 amidohydrolase [Altericroceibacterium endophyticum]
MKYFALAALAASTFLTQPAYAELSSTDESEILENVSEDAQPIEETALAIWDFAELGYKETQSSGLLQQRLKQAGFSITPGIAGEPTAFLASYKNGDGPVIALLAEFDALPGLSQKAGVGTQQSAGGIAGHGCGHNLFGTASTYAGIAVKEWMKANNIKGEVRVYGTPAEEGGSGKAFMVRDGYFDDVDIAIHWHPGNVNSASQGPTLANISGKFRFHGISAHAAGNPDKGRSALDGVEAMDDMVNMMREHIPDYTRIHYVITNGGKAPNVVPDFAEAYYYVRHQDPEVVRNVMEWVKQAAQGAALGTQTTVEFEQTGGVYSMMPNETLMHVMDRNLHRVGGITWTEEEKAFGAAIQKSFGREAPALDTVGEVEDAQLYDKAMGGSTDVSDVSWIVPTVGLSTATFVPGSPGHSWQNTAAAGSSVGIKGAVVATKTLALTAAELFRSPDVIDEAKEELAERVGPDFEYEALVGDRAPPLDYRDNVSKGD